MRNDEQVKAAVSMKKDIAINTGWKITCDNQEVTDWLTESLVTDLSSPFEDNLREILSAYEYGFSMSEPIYKIINSQYRWTAIKTRPPHSFVFNMDPKGDVKEPVQRTERGDVALRSDLMLHYVYQPEFGNPYGKSDLRAAHQAWVTKKFVLRFMAMYLERFAGPTVIGRYTAAMGNDEISRLNVALKSIQHSTTLVIPQDAQIEFTQTNRDSNETYIKAINLCNTMIARAILLPDLLGLSGEKTGGGSYSLGQTQFDLFMGTIKKDRSVLQRMITLKLLKPIVQLNFGDYPAKFEFNPITEEDESTYADIWANAVRGKIFTPNDDEVNHFRSILRFPQGPVEIPEPAPSLFDPNNPDNPTLGKTLGDGKKKGKDDGDEKDAEKKKAEEKKRLFTYRQRTAFEKKVDFSLAKDTLNISEEKVMPRLQSAARRIYLDLLDQIRTKLLGGRWRPEAMNELKPRFQKDMNLIVRRFFIDLFKQSYEQARAELAPDTKKKFIEDGKAGQYAEDDEPFMMPEEFLQILEAESFKVVGDYTMEVSKKMRNIIVNGLKAGTPNADIVTALRETAQDMSESWLSTVVRTKTTEVYNQARKSYWENDEIAKQIVEAYQFSAILDDRTTDICEHLDGNIYEIGDFTNSITPPLHFNCRSLLVPVTKFEDYSALKPESLDKLKAMGGGFIV